MVGRIVGCVLCQAGWSAFYRRDPEGLRAGQ